MKTYVLLLTTLLAIFCSADTTSHAYSYTVTRGFTTKKASKPLAEPIIPVTTAYYKPVKGQREYMTGTYKGDVRLNGTGITFSGKQARIGHIAADLRYNPVGTKFHVIIDDKDMGVWTVEDKGGAIKGPRRFDFFVGENDTGRIAAQSWGRSGDRKIEMYRVGING